MIEIFQRQKAEEETRKQREIEGLQKQLQQLKDMASGKAPVDESLLDKDVKKPPTTKVCNMSLLRNLLWFF